MNNQRISNFVSCLLLFLFALMILGCETKTSSKSNAVSPAKVEMVPHESELATLTLTPVATQRLGIVTVEAERRKVQQHRTLSGDVVVPSGRSIAVSAPMSGIAKSIDDQALPTPGKRVRAGDFVLKLAPLLSPERDVPTPVEQVQIAGAKATLIAAQATAQGDLERSRSEVQAAKISLERATKLLSDRAGSQKGFDDAQAVLNNSKATLKGAEERYQQLTKWIAAMDAPQSQGGLPTEITIVAPVDGVIRSLSVSAGQQIATGAPLFEVLDTSKVWIRVPVFVDLLETIPKNTPARIVSLKGTQSTLTSSPLLAYPVDAPPTANANSASADLYFEFTNTETHLRPGQRIGIDVPLKSEVEALIVPATAVLYDIYGGTWVYIATEPTKFVRKRVQLLWFEGELAVLQQGPEVGSKIVAAGAAELFGTEFGAGK